MLSLGVVVTILRGFRLSSWTSSDLRLFLGCAIAAGVIFGSFLPMEGRHPKKPD